MSNGVEILYSDVAPEAKENAIPSSSEKKFATLTKLRKYDMSLQNYAEPCEMYQTLLDGTAVAFPSNPTSANIGLYSVQLSNEQGVFASPINLNLQTIELYSSQGFTLTFDKFNDIYPTSMKIQWIRITSDNTTVLDTKTFAPNSSIYFCKNKVENFNKVIMTFYSINMPQNRLKVNIVDYGYKTTFYGDELRSVSINQELDPISTEISINTCDFMLDSDRDIEYSFQTKQPLTVKYNGNLIATTFVKSANRKSKHIWDIKSEDYISLMNNINFVGGIYNGEKAGNILENIFEISKVPYKISSTFYNIPLYGYIPYTTCRAALMQVAFACLAVVDTSNSDVVKVFLLDETITQKIPKTRIMQGQSFNNDNTVTGIEVTMHTYTPITETLETYKSNESGTGNGIFVKFSEPLHDLTITNGTITDSGTNFAVINASDDCVLTGQKYEHIQAVKRKSNPLVKASEIENVKSISNATLVSVNNIDSVLNKCYNYLIKTQTTNLKIIESKNVVYGKPIKWGEFKWGELKWGSNHPNVVTYDIPVNVGETITTETEYSGDVSGTVIKENYSLNGNIVVKQVVLK